MNIDGTNLEICSLNPLTGYTRSGKCEHENTDFGNHYVCSKMDKKFLDYTKNKGNDLSSVVKPGQNWCLCQNRWMQAYNDGKEPYVLTKSTNNKTRDEVKKAIKISLKRSKKKKTLKQKGGSQKLLPQLKPIDYSDKKHRYKLKYSAKKRRLALDEGVATESKKKKIPKRKAAISKKGRLNILRIYRRNKHVRDCQKITKDMKYLNKKYKLGSTKNICI